MVSGSAVTDGVSFADRQPKHLVIYCTTNDVCWLFTCEMFFADSCQFHSHQRGKLALDAIRHICSAYSAAHLDRLFCVRAEKGAVIDVELERKLIRKVGPPPTGAKITLMNVADALFHFDRPHHQRKRKAESDMIQSVKEWASFANGDLLDADAENGYIVHHCWQPILQEPCCASEARCVVFSRLAISPTWVDTRLASSWYTVDAARQIQHNIAHDDMLCAAGPFIPYRQVGTCNM